MGVMCYEQNFLYTYLSYSLSIDFNFLEGSDYMDSEISSIQLTKQTKSKLKEIALTKSESYENIILRLLYEYDN